MALVLKHTRRLRHLIQSAASSFNLQNGLTTESGGDEINLPHHANRTILLVNGDLQSSFLLAYWTHWNHNSNLIPLFVNHGQQSASKEEAAVAAMCKHLNLYDSFQVVNTGLISDELKDIGRFNNTINRHNSMVPYKHLMLLSVGASAAGESGARDVAMALTKEDTTTAFIQQNNNDAPSTAFIQHAVALFSVLNPPLRLTFPLIGMTKEQIKKAGTDIKVPWQLCASM